MSRDIKIAQRFHPFSHRPGVRCVLPGSTLRLECYSTCVKVWDFVRERQVDEVALPHQGPCQEFTVHLDLEKGKVSLSGFASTGYFLYHFTAMSEAPFYTFYVKKAPRLFMEEERLALGGSRHQEGDRIYQKGELNEFLPIWLRLGQTIPVEPQNIVGEDSWLGKVLYGSPHLLYSHLLALFKTGFEGLFSPRGLDTDLQGYLLPPLPKGVNPLQLLVHGAPLIRQLFCKIEGETVVLHPSCPKEFHSGRYLRFPCFPYGYLSFEWRSKSLRRVIFQAIENKRINIHLPKEIKQYRITCLQEKRKEWIKNFSPLDIAKGSEYCLDRFEK